MLIKTVKRTPNIQKISFLAQTLFELSQKNDRVGSQIDPPPQPYRVKV